MVVSDYLNIDIIKGILKLKDDGTLFHRESQELEFKEQFNFAGLADYFRDFAAFANNKGGYLIFGIKDKPKRILVGMSESSIEQFEKIDPEKITGFLLELFSCDIKWNQSLIEIGGLNVGAFYIYESEMKPIIAKKDEGKEQVVQNGEIYYRYGGRTQKVLFSELEKMINQRVEIMNKQWMDLVNSIGKAGPQNAAILDTQKGLIKKGKSNILLVDEKLIKEVQFIREGQFDEMHGGKTLKLVGSVQPVETVELIKWKVGNSLKDFPLSATELVKEVQMKNNNIIQKSVWDIIRENNIKSNKDYSIYIFRNKKQEDEFNKSGKLKKSVPSIYNYAAVDLIIEIYNNKIIKN